MTHSFYEVYINCLRACRSIGFPYGVNEDAAYMTSWLELHKLEGLKKLSELIKKHRKNLKKKIIYNKIKDKKIINLNKATLIYNGPSLFDYFYYKSKNSKTLKVKLENCIDPVFIIPLIKIYSKKFNYIKVFYLTQNKNLNYINAKKNKILISESSNFLKLKKTDVIIEFMIKEKKNKTDLDFFKFKRKIDFEDEQKKLCDSLEPKKIHWNYITKLAKKTFVPSSTISREKGAGGAGTDND